MTTDADRSSFFIGLVIVDIFVGLADAISLPYIVLFLVDKAALSPLSLGVILTARAAGSIAFSAAFGAWIDKYDIDGFRIDTAQHVNPEFWQRFVPQE